MNNLEAYNILVRLQNELKSLEGFTDALAVANKVAAEIPKLEETKSKITKEISDLVVERDKVSDQLFGLKSRLAAENKEAIDSLKASTGKLISEAQAELNKLDAKKKQLEAEVEETKKWAAEEKRKANSMLSAERERIDKALNEIRSQYATATKKLAALGGV